jgi:predicted peptidase
MNELSVRESRIVVVTKQPSSVFDVLLLGAIVVVSLWLGVILCDIAIEAWRNRPRPGKQVAQQFSAKASAKADTRGTSREIHYLLYLPEKYESSRRWPCVVFLHGSGECGNDLTAVRNIGLPKQVEQGRQFPFLVVSPQCPRNCGWNPEAVLELIDFICKSFPVDRDRIFLTGHSMGAFCTWETACLAPDRFAAVVPLCGGGDVIQAKRLVHTPVWAFHGVKDKTVAIEESRSMVDAINNCGGTAKLTEYPDAGHDINDITYESPQLYEWLLAQRRVSPSPLPQ